MCYLGMMVRVLIATVLWFAVNAGQASQPGQAAGAAQAPGGMMTAAPQASGVRPPWEARKTIDQLRVPLEKMDAALAQVQPQTWQGAGASNYAPIIAGARKQVRALLDGISVISQQPDRLSNVARLFIALYQIEPPIDAVVNGANQYRDYSASHAIQQGLVDLLNQRENFVKYLLELSEFDETSAALGRRELEACQSQLAQRVAPARKAAKK